MSTRKFRQPHDLMKTQSPCGLARDQRVLLEAVNKTGWGPKETAALPGWAHQLLTPQAYATQTTESNPFSARPGALARWGCVEIQAS